jgi:hypothetical protein
MGLVGLPHASPKTINLLKPSSFLLLSFMLYPSFERNSRAKDGSERRIKVGPKEYLNSFLDYIYNYFFCKYLSNI